MKKVMTICLAAALASAAMGDAFCVSSNNPAGSGNWNAASFFTASAQGGYLNPGNTGLGNKNPIESLGFYWKNPSGSNAERAFVNDNNCSIFQDGTDFVRDTFVDVQNNFEIGSPKFRSRLDYRLRPSTTSAAIWYIDWKITNVTATPLIMQWFVLGDLCSRTTTFGNNANDTVSYSDGTTTFSASGSPTIYFSASRDPHTFEVSKKTTGSDPDCRIKMQNGLTADTLADAVVGSGVGNWAAVYGYVLEMGSFGSESGTIAIGLDLKPSFVTGYIDLGILADDAVYPVPVTVEIRQAGTTTALETHTVNITNGSYVIGSNLPAGTYDLAFKGTHWLRSVVPGVVFPASGSAFADATLINGDVDGSNIINTDDYLILSENFDTAVTAGTLGDLDQNGLITTDDYLILSGNFDSTGDN